MLLNLEFPDLEKSVRLGGDKSVIQHHSLLRSYHYSYSKDEGETSFQKYDYLLLEEPRVSGFELVHTESIWRPLNGFLPVLYLHRNSLTKE